MDNLEINAAGDNITITHNIQLHDEDSNPYAVGSPPQFQFCSESSGGASSEKITAGSNAELKTAYEHVQDQNEQLRKYSEQLKKLIMSNKQTQIKMLAQATPIDYGQQALKGPGDDNSAVAVLPVQDATSFFLQSRKRRKCKLTASKTVDHRGNSLELGECGARLTILPGALPEGVKETITFTLDYKKGLVPGQVTPVARCLPTGLQFKEPVIVTVPNLKEYDGGDDERKGCILCNEEDVEQSPVWEESGWVKINNNYTTFYITHFSDYIVIDGKKYKKLKAVAYASKPDSSDWVQDIRLYVYTDRDEKAEQEVKKEEATLNGIKRGVSYSFRFPEENQRTITVDLTSSIDGWEPVSQPKDLGETISFMDIWHMGDGDFVCRQFMLVNRAKKDGRFQCSLSIRRTGQTAPDKLVEIYITNPIIEDKRVEEEQLREGRNKAEEMQSLKIQQQFLSSKVDHLSREVSFSRGYEAASSLPAGSIPIDSTVYHLRSATFNQQSLQQPQPNGTQTRQSVGFREETMVGLPSNIHSGKYASMYYVLPLTANPTTNVFQNAQTPKWHQSASSGVCQASVNISEENCTRLPYHVEKLLCNRLNVKHHLGFDWRFLASTFGMKTENIHLLEGTEDPASAVLTRIYQTQPGTRPQDIARVLRDMERTDAAMIIDGYLRESLTEPISTGENSSAGSSSSGNNSS